MTDEILQGLEVLVQVLEIIGAGALVLGFFLATGRCSFESYRRGAISAVERYQQSLGRTVLTGLEVLVAATIIKTITIDPSMESLGLLAIMVAIRTTLGWTTVLEMNRRWPWQRPRPNGVNSS